MSDATRQAVPQPANREGDKPSAHCAQLFWSASPPTGRVRLRHHVDRTALVRADDSHGSAARRKRARARQGKALGQENPARLHGTLRISSRERMGAAGPRALHGLPQGAALLVGGGKVPREGLLRRSPLRRSRWACSKIFSVSSVSVSQDVPVSAMLLATLWIGKSHVCCPFVLGHAGDVGVGVILIIGVWLVVVLEDALKALRHGVLAKPRPLVLAPYLLSSVRSQTLKLSATSPIVKNSTARSRTSRCLRTQEYSTSCWPPYLPTCV